MVAGSTAHRPERHRSDRDVTPQCHSYDMQAAIISGFLALFSFLFSWAEIISEVAERRIRSLLGIAALISMWVAFKYAPDEALGIVMSRVDGLEELANRVLDDIVRSTSHPAVEP